MFARLILLSLAASLGLAAAGCKSDDHGADADIVGDAFTPLPILAQHYGNDPGLTTSSVKLINSAEELKAMGSEELVNKNIDFKKRSLIVIAVGEQPTGGYWAHVTGVQRHGQMVYVQGVVNRPAADAIVTQALTYAYAAKVTGVLSSDIQNVAGQTPPAGE